MSLIVIGATLYMVYKLVDEIEYKEPIPQVDPFHMYSGVHPELYKEYLDNMTLYRDTQSKEFLKKAIYSLEELALYAEPEYTEEIHEEILKQESLFI